MRIAAAPRRLARRGHARCPGIGCTAASIALDHGRIVRGRDGGPNETAFVAKIEAETTKAAAKWAGRLPHGIMPAGSELLFDLEYRPSGALERELLFGSAAPEPAVEPAPSPDLAEAIE